MTDLIKSKSAKLVSVKTVISYIIDRLEVGRSVVCIYYVVGVDCDRN